MSYLTDKFKGIYRIKCPYDLNTNDFPRKLNGNYEDIDLYIDCQYGNKVFYYGRSILQAYIPSVKRGHNIIKAISELDNNCIYDIEETDEEILFKFHYNNSDTIIPLLKPKTSGASISPYSSRNRVKSKYDIPEEDAIKYKTIVSKVPKDKLLSIGHVTKNYVKSLCNRRNTWDNVKADMIKKGLKEKEYIHSIGKWDSYIKFLNENIEN